MNVLILFPGWARGRQSYKKLVDMAPKGWSVFVMPHKKTKAYKGKQYVNDYVLNFLDVHNYKQAYITGHSLGGALAMDFAASHPDRVKGLFLVDVKGLHDGGFLKEINRIYKESKQRRFFYNIDLARRVFRNPLLNFRLALVAHGTNVKKAARVIDSKIVIFWGEKDQMTPLEEGISLSKLIPSSNFIVLKDKDHNWITSDPALFWKEIAKE